MTPDETFNRDRIMEWLSLDTPFLSEASLKGDVEELLRLYDDLRSVQPKPLTEFANEVLEEIHLPRFSAPAKEGE